MALARSLAPAPTPCIAVLLYRLLEVAACACREEEMGTAEWIFVKK